MPIKFNEVTWYSKLGAVILFLFVVPALAFYIGMQYGATRSASDYNNPSEGVLAYDKNDSNGVTEVADPLDAAYTIDGETVTLAAGVSVESVAPGSAAKLETRAFSAPVRGDLNGDGQPDAVFFLYQETPGTGIFFYVVAAVNERGSYTGTNAVFLGDRIAPQNINIVNGTAAINYATRKDGEPMTADPSMGVTKYLKIKGRELVEVK